MQAPGGPAEDTSAGFKYGGWTVPYDDELIGEAMVEQMSLEHSELLLGRKTYEIFASYWPSHSSFWPGINEVKKFVASNDPTLSLNWENSVLLAGNIVEKVKKLKNEDRPNLHVWGSGNLVQTLLKSDLVDELWLKIFPVLLGSGKKLFAEGTVPRSYRLVKSLIGRSGVILTNYEKSGEVATGSY